MIVGETVHPDPTVYAVGRELPAIGQPSGCQRASQQRFTVIGNPPQTNPVILCRDQYADALLVRCHWVEETNALNEATIARIPTIVTVKYERALGATA